MTEKMDFANFMAKADLGVMASCVMSDCEKYGMISGCDINCPVLQAGKCELQNDENKELYQEYLDSK